MLDRSPLPLCVSRHGLADDDPHRRRAGAQSQPTSSDADPLLKELLFHELVDRGIYLAARGYVALSAAITDADCDRFVDALTDATDIDRRRRHGEAETERGRDGGALLRRSRAATGVIAPSATSSIEVIDPHVGAELGHRPVDRGPRSGRRTRRRARTHAGRPTTAPPSTSAPSFIHPTLRAMATSSNARGIQRAQLAKR